MAKNDSKVTTLDDEPTAPAGANTGVDSAAQAAADGVKILGKNHDTDLSGERKTITIHQTDTDGGQDAVAIGLNGYAYQIPRGIPVSIPVEVLEILKNS